MHEFEFKISRGIMHEKKIQIFYYDGRNIFLSYKNKITGMWDSWADRPFLELDYDNLEIYKMYWVKNGDYHRENGPALIRFRWQHQYDYGYYQITNKTNLHLLYGEKYINGKFLYKKEINSLKDWLTFDSAVI